MYYPDLSVFGVDNERLASERLSRLQQAMKQHDLAALMLTDWLNIRYATNSVFMMNLRATAIQRFVLVPQSGTPLICQRELSSRPRDQFRRFDAFMFGMRPPVATRDFARQTKANLRELGITTEQVGEAGVGDQARAARRGRLLHAVPVKRVQHHGCAHTLVQIRRLLAESVERVTFGQQFLRRRAAAEIFNGCIAVCVVRPRDHRDQGRLHALHCASVAASLASS